MTKRTRVIFFTKYTTAGSSTRYRSYQYFPHFTSAGIEVKAFALFPDKYVEVFYKTGRKSLLTALWRYIQRIIQLIFLPPHEIVFIEYELFPYLPLWFEKLFFKRFKKIMLDYDDAIFHNYDQSSNRLVRQFLSKKIYTLSSVADVIITGSPYLTEVFTRTAKKVVEIPTSIDLSKYPVGERRTKGAAFRIGWIGSKTTSKNIAEVVRAVAAIQAESNVEFVLIGFDHSRQQLLDHVKHRLIEWSGSTEVELIKTFDVGIMPLTGAMFNRGKCGFKLIQYMACALPTIASPFEANVKINHDSHNLFATTSEEWLDRFRRVRDDRDYYSSVGKRNREIVEQYYCLEANLPVYLQIFSELAGS